MQAAGIPMCAGTDTGAVCAFAGELVDEIRRLHHIGMSNLQAIQSATLNAAKLVGRENELGVVEPGKRSDVIMIEGNPLDDLTALRKIRYVGRAGFWYQPNRPEIADRWLGHSVTFTP